MLAVFPGGFQEVDGGERISELVGFATAEEVETTMARLPGAEAMHVAAGWADAWQAFHQPVRIGPLWIGPTSRQAEAGADALTVAVDAGAAFGTGAHPTTRLCVDLLCEQSTGSLLDVGCGSGVLSIVAAKLGFAPVVAIDLDPAAVQAARENARANGVAVDVRHEDALTGSVTRAEVAVANIELRVLERLAERLPVSILIASGYPDDERLEIAGWKLQTRRVLDGWAAERFVRSATNGNSGASHETSVRAGARLPSIR